MKKKKVLTTTQLILLGFLAVILAGSLLLALPVSSAGGEAVPFLDALFTATTATCVTGLVTLTTAEAWSGFGQAVILLLIQIGGLGVITISSGIMILLHRRIGIADRLLIQDAFNLNTLSGLVRFVKKVVLGTLALEGAGALLYMITFVPRFGLRGIWISVFNAVSAFCNAGMDVFSQVSLCDYVTDPLVNGVTTALIILGGIGYIVWWDILRVCRMKLHGKVRFFRMLTLHSKITLSATAILLLGGTLCYFVFEYNNPLTMQAFTLPEKLQASFFQSVTTRTAGFATIPQENFTNASSVVSLFLMFIGGSPVGTAGGVKTVTMAVLAATAFSVVKNKNEVDLFGRKLSEQAIRKAVAVTGVSFLIVLLSTVMLAAVCDAPALDIFYETVSATATVGLSRNLTASLDTWGKLIIIVTMYFGRVGPISLAIALNGRRKNENMIKNPTEEISVG